MIKSEEKHNKGVYLMNKKQLIAATLVALLSVSAANATNISGVTGNDGVYNINPEQVNGDVGFRYYDNFTLSEGDIANLIFRAQNGDRRALETFINLVNNKIDINGIVNTMRDGNFHNGHAVFISPKGMVVGASGVLNVGTLSVVTPTENKFNELKNDYNNAKFDVISDISKLRNGVNAINYGGNAPVDIQGKILTRGVGANRSGVGLDIRGSQVNISGTIVNGYNGADAFTVRETAAAQAAELFNKLVNTDGTIKAGSDLIADDAGRVVIKSGADVSATNKGGINVTGHIANLANTETAITNHGSNGLQVAGTVATNGKLNLYNNNTASALTVSGKLTNQNANMSLSSKGGIDVQSGANITTNKNLEIVNKGGALKLAGTAISTGKTDIVNSGAGGMNITGTVGDLDTTPSVRIVNENGQLVFKGNANAAESVSFRNSGTGMAVNGTVKAGEGVLVHNKAGDVSLGGTIDVENGDIAIMNEGTGNLTTQSSSNITNGNGRIAIKNTGVGGMNLYGTISNEGDIAINNLAGYAIIDGNIDNNGNIGIINKGDGTGLAIDGTINNEGKVKIVNSTGEQGLVVNGTVNNKTGDLYLYNDAGYVSVDGNLTNTESGNLYVLSRKNSSGIQTAANSEIYNEAGDLVIKHNGNGTAAAMNGYGMNLNGKITSDGGEIAINNYRGNMNVAGTITQNSNETIGIINRGETDVKNDVRQGYGEAMTVNATIKGSNINIKNNGSGDMTVNGEITHDGRLNILGNEGNLILGGKIHNTGTDKTYAASRANGDGIEVKSTFNADANNGGTILIKNITGTNGLKYEGTMTSNKQAEIYNKTGDMTVTGAINASPAVILNKGNGLTVTDDANLQGDVKIVNKGSEKATVADKYKDNFKESLKK